MIWILGCRFHVVVTFCFLEPTVKVLWRARHLQDVGGDEIQHNEMM